ncbi:MAG: NAD(P)H-dependent oxidoreductase [Methanomicrobiales archaeon]|nr:NAD(P)H-dependent oxidoreductase [Methanomicrobiales archaeon]
MRILVAYYSWKGHTETVAKELATRLNAPLVRIEPRNDPGPGMAGKAMKALFGMRSAIKPMKTDLADIDHLVVATPVWAGNMPPFTREYLAELTNTQGKKFSVLAEMGGSGADRVISSVRTMLERKGMQFVASAQTIEKDVEAGNVTATLDTFTRQIQTG